MNAKKVGIALCSAFLMAATGPLYAQKQEMKDRQQERGAKYEQMKKDMRALEDRQRQETRDLEDRHHNERKALRDRHMKERESLRQKAMPGK